MAGERKVIDVLYVSCARDIEWFQWSLHLLRKNLQGYRYVVVVCPQQDAALFSQISGIDVLHAIPDWPERGYFWQQWVKLEAWKYTAAEYVCHIDSDVMVNVAVNLMDAMFVGGIPTWPVTSYGVLGDSVPWQTYTRHAVGSQVNVDVECMRSFPFVIHRTTHELTCSHLVNLHGVSLEHYLRGVEGFSEFNVMGCMARQYQHDLYCWQFTEVDEFQVRNWLTQYWTALTAESFAQSRYLEQIPMLTADGTWVVSPDTHLSQWIRQSRRLDFDVEYLARLAVHIPRGGVVVDVGAFVGDHTLCYANMTSGTPGRVLAFEPNPVAFYSLKKNMAPYSHVECHNVGLSDCCGESVLGFDPNAGGMHLNAALGTTVKLIPLDSLLLPQLDFMKIDAEGFEPAVLRGAQATIERCKPVIALEVNEGALARQKSSSALLLRQLYDMGYRVEDYVTSPQCDVLCFPL